MQNTAKIKNLVDKAPIFFTYRRLAKSAITQVEAQLAKIKEHLYDSDPKEVCSLFTDPILLLCDAKESLEMETIIKDLKDAVKDDAPKGMSDEEIQEAIG